MVIYGFDICVMYNLHKYIGTILMVIIGFSLDSQQLASPVQAPVERATTGLLEREAGTLYMVGSGKETVYVIECADQPYRLRVMNMPTGFSSGTKVLISGRMKATQPIEDEWGDYFELTGISPAAASASR